MAFLPLLGSVVVLIGAGFMALAALGVLRMPDPYNRIQAGTKASTLGVVLALLGLGLYEPAWLPKLLVIAVFVLITNPLSSHALARAAHGSGTPLAAGTVRDALAEAKMPPAPVEADAPAEQEQQEEEEPKS